MHVVGRHTLARLLTPTGLSPSYVVSRRRAQWPATLARYRHEDWFVHKDGYLIPAIAGGTGWSSTLQYPHAGLGFVGGLSTPSQTTTSLNSAYTFNSAGAAIGSRFANFPIAKTLNSAYIYITAYGGTAANTNDLNFELRNVTSGIPGSTLHASGTLNPASATGWSALTGLSFSMSQDTAYFAVWGDADGNGTDFATTLRTLSADATQTTLLDGRAAVTTTGWASGNTINAANGSIVLGFSDNTAIGNPFGTSAASSSSQNQRGLYVAGFTEQIKILGMLLGAGQATNNVSGFNLWEGATGPSGSATANGTVDVTDNSAPPVVIGMLLGTPYTCSRSTLYRFVFTYSANATAPRKIQIGTGADATLKASMLGGSGWYWAEANGTTNWNNDDTTAWPAVSIVVEDQVQIATGGGSAGVIGS